MRTATTVVAALSLGLAACSLSEGVPTSAPRTTVTVPIIEPVTTERFETSTTVAPNPECSVGYERLLAVMGSVNGLPSVLETLGDDMRSLIDVMPVELHDDIDVLADAYGAYGTAAARFADIDDALADPAVAALADALAADDVAAARQRIEDYIAESCNVLD